MKKNEEVPVTTAICAVLQCAVLQAAADEDAAREAEMEDAVNPAAPQAVQEAGAEAHHLRPVHAVVRQL